MGRTARNEKSTEISPTRSIHIEDLLGREPVCIREPESVAVIHGRVIMITGAGGSIGSELCRQILEAGPTMLLLVEQTENNLYDIHRELQQDLKQVQIVPAIANVCDEQRMRELFRSYAPDIVFHAAAHKHVPMMEANPCEALKNNTVGTRIVADLASEFHAQGFVLISTDKAVNPSSVMGATKRLAEMYIQALQESSRTRFVSVRFGNVLGSLGSVIPLFQEQIDQGGPVTVTHPEMLRYFMTISEACQLVLEAGAIGQGGEILVLDMGEPLRILDLAKQMIRWSGLEPGRDIKIEFTGTRPGEKLSEELSSHHEVMDTTRCPQIFVHMPAGEQAWTTPQILRGIELALADAANVSSHLEKLVTSYRPLTNTTLHGVEQQQTATG
ncbi:MAG: nucleoside-diphosphate sugar epimerase/dehydratase [Planctomycetota bacterium]|nr:nucleoside-diphosphate sugar epimerase/dehydratase [Planctomycetota bacterium]